MALKHVDVLNHLWKNFLEHLPVAQLEQPSSELARQQIEQTEPTKLEKFLQQRSLSMGRAYDQLWMALYENENGYARPIDIYLDGSGSNLFSIVAQDGKLFQVPLTISQDTLTLGEWVQVEEEFSPVKQNRFFVRRQKDGRYRWTAVAGTSILNRAGEIDSIKLFDCFIQQSQDEGLYPRLDFYHKGDDNPEIWEFGTADFLAREGVCYLASGLFDEGHPLAEATIRACEAGDIEWGCSIEFYSYSEPEIIISDPEVKIPVYNAGVNTRISVVKEKEAAALFTRIGVIEEEGIKRTMDERTKNALTDLYGADTEGLKQFMSQFEEGVDRTNKRVADDKLIHRSTKAKASKEAVAEEVEDEEVEDEGEDTDDDEDSPELVLDDEALAALTTQMLASPRFRTFIQTLAGVITQQEQAENEIADLKEQVAQLSGVTKRLKKTDAERKAEYLGDMPSKKRQVVTYRASDKDNYDDDELEGFDPLAGMEDFGQVADRTISKIGVAY